jgi:hypothetical protein
MSPVHDFQARIDAQSAHAEAATTGAAGNAPEIR